MQSNVNLWFAKDKYDNIITINEIEISENNKDEYYCPLCGSIVIPKATKSKLITAHFAHVDASKCNIESIYHWWFKNKFLESGDKFKVVSDKEIEYVCREVLVEQSYTVGDKLYRPDVTIKTECGNIIYFEMKFSNEKKLKDYIDIWLELKNIVVEVDIKSLLSKDKLPTFKALFYDGKCFNVKKRSDDGKYHDAIGRHKEDILSKVDKINDKLKERLKKLDWFWNDVLNYKKGEKDIEYMVDLIDSIDDEDKDVIFNILKKPKCVELYSNYNSYQKNIYIKGMNDIIEIIHTQYDNLINITFLNDIYPHINIQSKLRNNEEWNSIGYSSGGSFNKNTLNRHIDYINNQIQHEIKDIKNFKYFQETLRNKILLSVIEEINKEIKLIHINYNLELSKYTYNPNEYYNGCLSNKYDINFVLNFNGGWTPSNVLTIDITNEYNIRNSDNFNDIYDYFKLKINNYRNNLIFLDDRVFSIMNELSNYCNNELNINCSVKYKSEDEICLWFTKNRDYLFDVTIHNNKYHNYYSDSDIKYISYNIKDYTDMELKNILLKLILDNLIWETKSNCKDCGENFELTIGEIKFFNKKGLEYPRRCKSCRDKRKLLNNNKGG